MELVDLAFAGEGAWRAAAAALGEAELARLREADCSYSRPPPEALSLLLRAPLARLSLEGTRLGPALCAALGAALPGSLAELQLGGCFVGDAGLAAVLASPPPALVRLGLALCGLSGLDPLGGLALEALDVGSNGLGPGAAEQLAALVERSPRLAELRCAAAGALGDAGLARLARACAFAPLLRLLDVSAVGATAAAGPHLAEALAACPALLRVATAGNGGLRLPPREPPRPPPRGLPELGLHAGLAELRLCGEELPSSLHAQLLPALAAGCPSLRELRLDRCGLRDAAVAAAWPSYAALLAARLALLSLCDNLLSAASCDLFVAGLCRAPVTVRLWGNAVPPAALLELHAVCAGGPAAAALLRRQSTPSAASSASPPPAAIATAEEDAELFVRRAAPNRALVPRPRHAPSLEHMAAKYGLSLPAEASGSPGGSGGPGGAAGAASEVAALRADREVLLSLYQRLVAEHAEVCLAYDAAVARARAQGLALPDLAAVKARAPN